MTNPDPVDVLIIGAGASGAPVAWSLAETKMHILPTAPRKLWEKHDNYRFACNMEGPLSQRRVRVARGGLYAVNPSRHARPLRGCAWLRPAARPRTWGFDDSP
jgi:hypothetical protein